MSDKLTFGVQTKYCPGCGEMSYTYSVRQEEGTEIRCSSCGFPLEFESRLASQETGCIMIADGDKTFHTVLTDLLTKLGFSDEIVACESGQEFLTLATARLHRELSIRLAILDIMTYPLDGTAVALAFRAVEKGFKGRPTPILFLSAVRADETLRRLIARCQPALYLNKGVDSRPDQLGPRLEKVIAYLLQQGDGGQYGRNVDGSKEHPHRG